VNLVNLVNFVAALSREPLNVMSLLCSHRKLIERKEIDGLGRLRGQPDLTPEEVHNVHEVHSGLKNRASWVMIQR
jgi:hypothetical protein